MATRGTCAQDTPSRRGQSAPSLRCKRDFPTAIFLSGRSNLGINYKVTHLRYTINSKSPSKHLQQTNTTHPYTMMEASAAKEAAARTKARIPATGNQLRHDSSREDSVETPKSPDVTNLDSTLGVQTDGGGGVQVSLNVIPSHLMEDSEEEGALSPQPAAAPKRQKYHGSNPVCMRSGTQAPDLSAVLPPGTPDETVVTPHGSGTGTNGVQVGAKRTSREQEEWCAKKKQDTEEEEGGSEVISESSECVLSPGRMGGVPQRKRPLCPLFCAR